MYFAHQTLRHIRTNKLVALHPAREGTWHWDDDTFIDETGKVFKDDVENYTHIENWFGQAEAGDITGSQNPYVDVSLKQYLVSKEVRKKKKAEVMKEWTDRLLKRLETENNIACPFSVNGQKCWDLTDYFLKLVKAKPLVVLFNDFDYKGASKYITHDRCFRYKGKIWLFREILYDLIRVKKVNGFIN